MSSFLNDVLRLLEEIVAADGDAGVIRENVEELYVSGTVDSTAAAALQTALMRVRDDGLSDVVVVDRHGETIPIQSVAGLSKRVQVRLLKPNTGATYYFYDARGLRGFFGNDAAVAGARAVMLARGIEPFRTLQCLYARWEDALIADPEPSPTMPAVEVRRLVVDLTQHVRVPSSVGNLLLPVGAPLPDSPALREWQAYAARALPAVLVNEVRATDAGDVFALSAPRRVTMSPPATEPDDALFWLELEAARWVYAGGAGIENRHTFFTTELSRAWRTETSWDAGFRESGELALESARSAERLFASGKTSEVLKALGDLRKALNEEVAKVTQQARDLGTGLWRDVAIAVGALAAKAASSGNTSSVVDAGVRALLVGIATFLVYSLHVTLCSNKRFLDIARIAREKWTRQTYSFLSDADLRNLASDPIKDAEEVYEWTVRMVRYAYAAMVLVLLLAASWPLPAALVGTRPSRAPSVTPSPRSSPTLTVTPKPRISPRSRNSTIPTTKKP